MFKLDGKTLTIDTPFMHGDFQYPANWLRLASPAERAALGITEEAEPVRADDRFYWNGDVTQPRDLAQAIVDALPMSPPKVLEVLEAPTQQAAE